MIVADAAGTGYVTKSAIEYTAILTVGIEPLVDEIANDTPRLRATEAVHLLQPSVPLTEWVHGIGTVSFAVFEEGNEIANRYVNPAP